MLTFVVIYAATLGVFLILAAIFHRIGAGRKEETLEKERRRAASRLVSPSYTRGEYISCYERADRKKPNIYKGRVAHLAFRHRKARVRKKNMKRILRGK